MNDNNSAYYGTILAILALGFGHPIAAVFIFWIGVIA